MPKTYPCQKCDKVYSHRQSLHRHTKKNNCKPTATSVVQSRDCQPSEGMYSPRNEAMFVLAAPSKFSPNDEELNISRQENGVSEEFFCVNVNIQYNFVIFIIFYVV